MKRVAALGLVAIVFAAGLAAGLLGSRLLHGTSDRPRDIGPPPLQRYFERGDLRLTADQERRIEEVFSRQRQKFETMHRELRPEVEALLDETQEQVEAILTPDQRERFRARRHRWQHRPGRYERMPPGPRNDSNYGEAPPESDTPPPAHPDVN